MTSAEQIVTYWTERKSSRHPLLTRMGEIRDAYNGDLIVPLPEMERDEKAAIINLVNDGINYSARKIASVTPDLWCASLAPGNRPADKRAAIRRRAILAWWEQNRMGLLTRRRARHLVGYGTSPVILRPDAKKGIAKWEVRNPLTTYPAPSPDPDEITPTDVIFQFQRTLAWLTEHHADKVSQLYKGKNPLPSDRFDLLEYADGDETVMICLGAPRSPIEDPRATPVAGADVVELLRVPNRIGMCPVVMPGRITLDRITGQFDQLLGPMFMQSKLMALDLIAVEKAVFPDMYLVSHPNETAEFLAGPFDGRTGQVNIVRGGQMTDLPLQPGYQTGPMIDRLERIQRISGGQPAEAGGESASNVRTGKRGDAIMAEVVDTNVQEMQEILAAALVEENRRAVAISKTYFGNRKMTFTFGPANKTVDYIPNRDFDTDHNRVTYPMPGTDANGLVVGGGQRIGLGTMSKRSFMELDPMVADPQREMDRVQFEALETAVLSSIQQQSNSGTLPLTDVIAIMDAVVTDKKSLMEAVKDAQAQAQARQAQQVTPDQPEAQPGLAQPGMGVEPTPGSVPQENPNIHNLAQMLRGLQTSGRPTQPSRPVNAA